MPPRNRRGVDRAPARPFYKRVQQELIRQRMSQKALLEAAEVQPSTFYLLQTSPPRDLMTRTNTVLRLARVLGIGEEEALQLAGLPSTAPEGQEEQPTTPEDAIARVNAVDKRWLNEQQKGLVEDMIQMFVRLNERAQERDDYGSEQTG